jgi:D-lactate dehydrogenase (cytochrome)
VTALAREFGALSVESATTQQDRNRLWRARHEAYYAGLALRPGSKGFVTDVCVPISSLARCIAETKADIEKTNLIAPILGHVGDGNFHVSFFIDPARDDELEQAQAINRRMVARAIAMGGTCSGEHGVGYGKAEFLAAEHGEALNVMAAIKKALDPQGILNPGKMTDAALEGSRRA